MNLWDVVKSVGTAVVKDAVPGGAAIIDAINAVLPDGKKLPVDATGQDAASAVQSLPPEQRSAVMEKQFDVDIATIQARASTLSDALKDDKDNPQTARPYIAKGAFQIVAVCTLAVIFTWCGGIWLKRTDIVKAAQDGWPFVLSVLAPLTVLLRAYFGILKTEHRHRLEAASGKPLSTGLAGAISQLLNKGKSQ